MTVRRSAAALATTAVLLGVAAPVAVAPVAVAAPSPSPSADLPAGLYGTTDPTYDGVWRQSLAFLAQKIEYVTPSTQAVDWLVGQQCDSGAFTSYRADTSKPCDASTVMDTNATAIAVQALVEINQRREDANNGADWLKSVQNEDGGWGYNPGSPSDANSTSIVIGALARTGVPVNELTTANGSTPYTALRSLAIACGEKDGGAFAYQPGKKGELAANMDATAASVLGLMGKGIASGTSNAVKDPSCTKGDDLSPEQTAQNGASFLADTLKKQPYLEQAPMPGAEESKPQPDYGNTSDAVVALAASGHADKAKASVAWLQKNGTGWAKQGGPAATAQLILAAHATGADARSFGGVDLVKQLNSMGPSPAATALPSPTPTGPQPSSGTDSDDGGLSLGWLIGIGLLAGTGIGFLLSMRGKKKQP
ncbi:terpene cyclase/mutase family protein [Streptomyces sp. MBT56]|uniref:prenyltransferase/squalene oxidase repeat-containing protein n=1 Tax=unclassified Streptomyces TaxID=2593676 RepID=UPI00190C3B11|nr:MULTISPECIES: prenyltransferase/squalene oxidase repeat-containing protein [unclassified Streptomyces]MBK3557366.1 terpene cyclase/mutase family protein [Streptomyces sp. MBT56]MBK3601364.1 terpene cyclase/mutase family protein [Streptomyces sp. MBT54]MBK3613660.1 terpene cyclase/mutase family protein [Streptomyces sp. MBT98]